MPPALRGFGRRSDAGLATTGFFLVLRVPSLLFRRLFLERLQHAFDGGHLYLTAIYF
jgi:hypothetical protein